MGVTEVLILMQGSSLPAPFSLRTCDMLHLLGGPESPWCWFNSTGQILGTYSVLVFCF